MPPPRRQGHRRSAPARRIALDLLARIDRERFPAERPSVEVLLADTLDAADLSDRDSMFATDLVLGTTRLRRGCDALVDRFVAKPPSAELRAALRLGAYQLHYLGIAAHAAVGETVAALPTPHRPFVNAVLRRVATTKMTWPRGLAGDALRLSYPDWVVERLSTELGHSRALDTLAAMNWPTPATAADVDLHPDLDVSATIIDAPSTGLGALRSDAEGRWLLRPDDVDAMVAAQAAALRSAATAAVAPGGDLVLRLRTFSAAESVHPAPDGFDPIHVSPGPSWQAVPGTAAFRLLPQTHDTDGLTILRYRRRP
jgi:transcription termination factor NusB